MSQKSRILTGMRPTGPLHLGHYVGALQQWLELQATGQHDCFFLVADAQALTDHADDPRLIQRSVRDVVLDWLAVGLDPQKSAFVLQSLVPETFELEHLLACITPQSWVERNPTLKAEIQQLRGQRGQTVTSAFMRYPVSQAADILNLAGADRTPILVPVGEDQVPHIELTRDIARAFNSAYGNTLPEPQSRVGAVARLVGTDGQDKMSKSLGNVINLSDSATVVRKQAMRMYTDPTRAKVSDPGHLEGNVPFMYLDIFDPDKAGLVDLKKRYEMGGVGDVEVKERLVKVLNVFLDPIRERRAKFEKEADILAILYDGTARERIIAKQTLEVVKKAMGLNYMTARGLLSV